MSEQETLGERESMDVDVVIVGAGPAGLAAAIRLKQIASEKGEELSVVVLEKGSEVGAHILSGAVIDPIALDKLLPEWREEDTPIKTPVTADHFLVLGPAGSMRLPNLFLPKLMNNHG
ncbi:MAG: FAD-dependent oxidoreductase, partial [Roseibium sp.]